MNASNEILIDTGPLVALVDRDEANHFACWEVLSELPRRRALVTTAPVLTEVFYLLRRVKQGPDKLFELLRILNISIANLSIDHLVRVEELMKRYGDLPMDFADAVVVAVAEEQMIRTVMTLDYRDFQIYRPLHVKRLELLPRPK